MQAACMAGDSHRNSGGLTILNAVSITQNRSNVNTDNGCLLCLSILQRRLVHLVRIPPDGDFQALIPANSALTNFGWGLTNAPGACRLVQISRRQHRPVH